jgi:arylsulfatase A-like enzyme
MVYAQIQRVPPARTGRSHVYGEFTSHFAPFPQRMVRNRSHKFIFNAPCQGELYDLANDPFELDNRIDDESLSDVKRELISTMIEQMTTLEDPLVSWLKRIQDFY